MIGKLWNGVERALEAVMAAFVLAMAVITVIDVIGRYFFNSPMTGGYEFVQYLMALSVFAALPLATRAEGHLTIDLFTSRLGGRTKRVHRSVILIASTIVIAFLAWRMGVQAEHMQRANATSGAIGFRLAPLAWTMAALAWLATLVSIVLTVQSFFGGEAHKRHMEDVG